MRLSFCGDCNRGLYTNSGEVWYEVDGVVLCEECYEERNK